jgi:hypothetical protein
LSPLAAFTCSLEIMLLASPSVRVIELSVESSDSFSLLPLRTPLRPSARRQEVARRRKWSCRRSGSR